MPISPLCLVIAELLLSGSMLYEEPVRTCVWRVDGFKFFKTHKAI